MPTEVVQYYPLSTTYTGVYPTHRVTVLRIRFWSNPASHYHLLFFWCKIHGWGSGIISMDPDPYPDPTGRHKMRYYKQWKLYRIRFRRAKNQRIRILIPGKIPCAQKNIIQSIPNGRIREKGKVFIILLFTSKFSHFRQETKWRKRWFGTLLYNATLQPF